MTSVKIWDRRFKFGERFLPRINRPNRHEKSEKLKNVELLPKLPDGEPHPLPYYRTTDSLPELLDPPWKQDAENEEKEKFQMLFDDPRHPISFSDSILKETVDEEIMAIASSVLSKIKHKKDRDVKAIEMMEDDILVPTVQREVFVSVWELLYEWGRDLTRSEFKELDQKKQDLQMDPSAVEALTAHMFEEKEDFDDLSEERALSANRWDVLLYNYYVKLQQNAYKHNVAFHMMQERLITTAAADTVLKEVIKILVNDMVVLDEKEKTDNPPRLG